MPSNIKKGGFAAAAICVLLAIGVGSPARAADVGPYFPLPNYFDTKNKDEILEQVTTWIKDGISALEKAKRETQEQLDKNGSDAALQEKLKSIDAQIESAVKERDILTSDAIGKEAELQRKNVTTVIINKWINAVSRKATEALKIAILKDGLERDAAERRHIQLSGQADELERVKHHSTYEAWGR
jgi:hypothetical protein